MTIVLIATALYLLATGFLVTELRRERHGARLWLFPAAVAVALVLGSGPSCSTLAEGPWFCAPANARRASPTTSA